MAQSQPMGFLAEPPGGPGPGVLVLHAWWGLNESIKSFCRRLSGAGFSAFAPDMYHGKVVDSIAEAQAMVNEVDAKHLQTEAEVAEASRFLFEHSGLPGNGLAVIGFSMGGYYALNLAGTDVERVSRVVLFYGSGDADLVHSKAAFQGHFAENDPYEPPEGVDMLEAYLKRLGRPVNFYRYPGVGHWFFEPDRTEDYNPAAANLAWERTLAFLNPE